MTNPLSFEMSSALPLVSRYTRSPAVPSWDTSQNPGVILWKVHDTWRSYMHSLWKTVPDEPSLWVIPFWQQTCEWRWLQMIPVPSYSSYRSHLSLSSWSSSCLRRETSHPRSTLSELLSCWIHERDKMSPHSVTVLGVIFMHNWTPLHLFRFIHIENNLL